MIEYSFGRLSLSLARSTCADTCSRFLNEFGLKSAGQSTSIQQAADVTYWFHQLQISPFHSSSPFRTPKSLHLQALQLSFLLFSSQPPSFVLCQLFQTLVFLWVSFTLSVLQRHNPSDYPCLDLLASHSLIGKCPTGERCLLSMASVSCHRLFCSVVPISTTYQ